MTAIPAHLPHRPPLLLVDRLLAREPGVRVVAEKLLAPGDPCLRGAPGGRVPGPLLVEMLAQAGAFLEEGSLHGAQVFLAAVPEARFPEPARAGDRLRLEVRRAGAFAGLTKLEGTVTSGGRELCAATLLVKRT